MSEIGENIYKIQFELYKKLKKRLEEYEKKDSNLQKYEKKYFQEINEFERIATKEELIAEVIHSDVVFIGDFHTLRQAQKIPQRILSKVLENSVFQVQHKGIVLCMEAFLSEHQKYINLYLKDKIDERKFLALIEYEKTWGQNWKHYKTLIDFAKNNGIKVFGINTFIKNSSNSLQLRDKFAIEKIAELLLDFPKHLIVVFYGDAHLTYNYIPRGLIEFMKKKFKKHINYLIIHQNSDSIYWRLAKLGLADLVDAVYIKPKIYCIINTTPISKLQSQINWYENNEELRCVLHPEWCEPVESVSNLCDEVKDIVDELTSFLGIKINCDDLLVLSIHNIKDLAKVIPRKLTPQALKKIEEIILKNESYYIPKQNIIILSNYSINHVAEEAMHYIHSKLAKFYTFDKLNPVDRFYATLVYEAIGFCGSKIINHKRKCYKIKDFYDYILYLKNRKIKDTKTAILKEATKKVIKHYEMEQLLLNRKKCKKMGKFYEMKFSLFITVTHALGYMLGDKLFQGLKNGYIDKNYFLKLLRTRIDIKGKMKKLWQELIFKLKDIKESYISKEEIL
ncbi:MAG: ChaN family lipoprotein [Planctomycetota bacterium]